MKKIISLLIATTLMASVSGNMATPIANAISTNVNSLTIAVDEDFGDLNILTMTEHSYSSDYIFTMAYDTLLTLDENGNFQPGLVDSWEIDGDSYIFGSSISDDIEVSDKSDRTPPGWREVPFDPSGDNIFFSDDLSESGGIVYTLRSGLQFQNGEDFSAQSIEALIDFAKLQPHDTLIYKQWAPITINIIEDNKFSFLIDLTSFPMGNMDFRYTLASPIGSMVNVSGFENGATISEIPKGTGAYEIETITESSVTLTRNTNWWNIFNPVTMQTVTFEYCNDSENVLDNMGAIYDAAIMSDRFTEVEKQNMIDYNGYGVYTLERNPMVVEFNPTSTLFEDYRTRTAFSLAFCKGCGRRSEAMI